MIGDSSRADTKGDGLRHTILPYTVLAGFMLLLIVAIGCQHPNVGLIANMGADRVTAFDAQTNTLQDDVKIPKSRWGLYTMAIHPEGSPGFVSGGMSPTIHVLSLKNLPPLKVKDTFNATHSATLLATSQQNILLLVTAGMDGGHGVVSTMTLNGNQIDRIDLGQNTSPMAISLCDDGKTLLVAVDVPHEVRKLAVANDGSLSDTGTSYSLKHGTRAADVLCASGSKTGVVLIGHGGATGGSGAHTYAESFEASSMSRKDTQRLAKRVGASAVFSPNGQTLYVRTDQLSFLGQSYIEAFSFNPQSGQFGSVTNASAPPVGEQFLTDSSQLAIDENGNHLFVTDRWNDQVLVLETGTLSQVQTLSGNLTEPLSITTGH